MVSGTSLSRSRYVSDTQLTRARGPRSTTLLEHVSRLRLGDARHRFETLVRTILVYISAAYLRLAVLRTAVLGPRTMDLSVKQEVHRMC